MSPQEDFNQKQKQLKEANGKKSNAPEEEEFSSIKELSKNDTNYPPNSNEESKNESQNKSKDNKLTQEEDEFSFKQESSQNDTIHPPIQTKNPRM